MKLDPIPDDRKAVRVPDVDPAASWKPYRDPPPPGPHPHDPPGGRRLVGSRIPLVDGPLKATGQAAYTDDLRLPGMLHGRFVRSTRAHARIVRIDASRAMAMPGVVAVLTGLDTIRLPDGSSARIGDRRFGVLPLSRDEEALPAEKVRFVGDYVALVAAEDEATADAAARAVTVAYADLPACLDPQEGLHAVAEKVHADAGLDGSNVQKHVDQEFGDPESAFRAAALVLRGRFTFRGLSHGFTEPHCVIANAGPGGRLTVWSATQVPHYVQRALADVTGLPMHRIQVIRPTVGGGFGGKGDPFPFEASAALMALKVGRPVKVRLDREEVFYSGRGRHPTDLEMGLALDAGGGLKGLDVQAVLDGGAYASFGIITTYYTGVMCMGPYKMPAFRYRGRRVYTNHVPSGAMRGHGGVNNRFALEVLLDEVAERLGQDPIDLRLRNLMAPYSHTVNGFRITSMGLRECLERVRQGSGWDERFRRLPVGRGLGVGCGFFISGSNLPIHWDIPAHDYPQSTVHLKLDMDGGVTIHTGAADIGQGSDTVAALVVAEVLGLGLDRIRVRSQDSDTAPVDLGSYSSRVTFMMGNAARRAAEDLRRQILAAAARRLGGHAEAYVLRDGEVVDATDPRRRLGFDEATRAAIAGSGALVAKGTFVSTPMGGAFKGATAGLAPAYSVNACVAEVDVDVETGAWACTKAWVAHDCGRALNRLAVEGQIEGSFHMGLGQVHGEGLESQGAALRNANLLEYKIPTALDTPQVISYLVESNDLDGPFGAKEAGEGPLLPVLPAIANAIYDAVGVRCRDLPATPDRIHALLQAAGGPRKPVTPGRGG